MNRKYLNFVLAGLLLLTLALIVGVKVDYTKPNYEVLPTMVHSPASDAYSANSNFPNGRTLQSPVEGTIPRGDLPLYFKATKEDAVRAGNEIENPFAALQALITKQTTTSPPPSTKGKPTKKSKKELEQEKARQEKIADARTRLNVSVQRGAETYNVFCISCHGSKGAGDGPVTKRGFPPPPPLPTGKSVQMKDGQLFHILTYGQGSMAPMVAQLSRERRWDVINFVRTLQKNVKQPSPQKVEPKVEPKKIKTSGNTPNTKEAKP